MKYTVLLLVLNWQIANDSSSYSNRSMSSASCRLNRLLGYVLTVTRARLVQSDRRGLSPIDRPGALCRADFCRTWKPELDGSMTGQRLLY
jgi:hypothetical protein